MNAGTQMILDAENRFRDKGWAIGLTDGVAKDIAERIVIGIARGEDRGKATGKYWGERKGRNDTIIAFIREKFGPVPEELRNKILGTPEKKIDGWIRRVLNADSLDELIDGRRRRKRKPPA